ncbi:MAG TPA: polysaccharide biosynthesis/export family protein [Bryobacteraceae bacterium]|jgi:polysaccharide export outer membrane protein|nr:polysaccharide biosynthesis/export family protein [Bryobacteraceae bacterium]
MIIFSRTGWLLAGGLIALGATVSPAQQIAEGGKTPEPSPGSLAVLSQLQPAQGEQYTIGEGDEVEIQVVGRPELSGSQLVGPDGRITLPIAGSFEIHDLTREEAARRITTIFQRYYTTVDVTVRVSKYGSNRILVLGHVDQPGVFYFEGMPTLLDVLMKSRRQTLGNGPATFPSRCAIFRGKEQAFWIDLKSMLDSGSAAADVRLRRNDVVYVPDEAEDQVSVLGEVQRPGMVRLEPTTTLAQVLALSGGLTPAAGSAKIEIVRQGANRPQEIAFKDLVDPRKGNEISLKRGDVIYVQKGSLAKFAYVLQQIAPAGTMMMFATTLK